jgi:hypothetical protein
VNREFLVGLTGKKGDGREHAAMRRRTPTRTSYETSASSLACGAGLGHDFLLADTANGVAARDIGRIAGQSVIDTIVSNA